MSELKKISIGSTDIFLEDYEPGQGKITISDTEHGAFTHYWGAMGSNISEFVQSINTDYFVRKLSSDDRVFSAKKSVQAIRRYIRNDMKYDLPWYRWPDAQKELREFIEELEQCHSEENFVDECYKIPKRIIALNLDKYETEEFEGIVKDIFTNEPWNFIEKEPSQQAIWLTKLLPKLQKQLRKC